MISAGLSTMIEIGQQLYFKKREVPLESRTDEGEVGVVILNEDDKDAHAIMAKTLPKYVIIQSDRNDKYLHLYTENPKLPNALVFAGDYSFGLETRFEVVPATTGTGLVHIRSLHNNKYWAAGTKCSGVVPYDYVTAMAVKPEENQSNKHCTLFQPVFKYSNNNRVLKLRHVRTAFYVSFYLSDDNCLYLDHWPSVLMGSFHDSNGAVCTFIDWESVVMLPDLIRIKGENGNHLKAYDGNTFMDYNHKADNSSSFDYEVSPTRDGGIRLKSTRYGTYWTDSGPSCWVILMQASSAVHDTSTVFLPTILGGNRIIMRSFKSNYIGLKQLPNYSRLRFLATFDKYPDELSPMEIEEPIISRKIDNVRYRLTEARLYNEKSVVLITDDSSNRTQHPFTSELNLMTTVTNTTNWSTSVTLKVGGKMSFTAGVPTISKAEIDISAEVTGSLKWGETKTENLEVGTMKTITVPPMSRVKASLLATRVSYDIPFSYTQRDVLMNGIPKVSVKHDGLFSGNDGYGYTCEVLELPLDGDGDVFFDCL